MESSRSLPSDIIFQRILVRVPSKSILRFLCVSKSWLSSLTHPKFIQLYQNHCKAHMLFLSTCGDCTLLRENPFELTDLTIPKLCEDNCIPIGSANGLVCLSMMGGFYVWNPFIRSGKRIPQTPAPTTYNNFKVPILFCMGFGFDARTNDYKLIVIPLRAFPDYVNTCRHEQEDVIYMYSMNNSAWKEVQSTVGDFICEDESGISFAGSIYWIAQTKGLDHKKIISFNFESERFTEIMLPNYKLELPNEYFGRSSTTFSLQVVDESIHLSIIPDGRSYCHIWMLKHSYGTNVESWVKKKKVELPGAFWFYSKRDRWITGLTHDGWLCVSSYNRDNILKPTSNYLLYDPKNNKFQNSQRAGLLFNSICLTESLVGLPHQEKQPVCQLYEQFRIWRSSAQHLTGEE